MRLYRWVMNQVRKSGDEAYHYWVYIRCHHCDEILKTHIDLCNELSIQYGEDGAPDTYFTRKIVVGSTRCFEPITLELKFDARQRLSSQNITGGELVSEEEYYRYTRTNAITD